MKTQTFLAIYSCVITKKTKSAREYLKDCQYSQLFHLWVVLKSRSAFQKQLQSIRSKHWRQKNKHITCLPIKLLSLQVFFVLRSKLSTFFEIGLPLRGPVAAFKKLNNSRFSDSDPWRYYLMAVCTNRAGDFRSSRSFVLACGGTLSKEFIQMSSWSIKKKTLLITSLREP